MSSGIGDDRHRADIVQHGRQQGRSTPSAARMTIISVHTHAMPMLTMIEIRQGRDSRIAAGRRRRSPSTSARSALAMATSL
jgi:hypothetical protein